MLGWHWVGTLRGCATPPTPDRVTRALQEIPEALGLHRLGEPIVRETGGGGLVGIVLLSTSHASIHVPGAGSDVLCDVFSCASFDAEACASAFRSRFAPAVLDWTVLPRG